MSSIFHKAAVAFFIAILLLCGKSTALAQDGDLLVQLLARSSDTSLQLDILNGMARGLEGRRSAKMPPSWSMVEQKLGESGNAQVQTLVQTLSLKFGSPRALKSLRETLANRGAELTARRAALDALLSTRDPELPKLLLALLNEEGLRSVALRGLASEEIADAPSAILAVYPSLKPGEKKDALNTLSSRASYAKELMQAVSTETISHKELTAEIVRQLRSLKNEEINSSVEKIWGAFRETSADRKAQIEQYKKIYWAGGSQPGDASRGRAVFNRVCQQCHTLFDTGGKVGPDLTGSARADLNYILENMVDPNAVIPNDYRSSTIETRDERIITGILKQQNEKSVTIATANETIIIPRNEILSIQQSDISMMPEGLLQALGQQEIRDLIYYLGRPGQVPLPN
ncbi:MAG: c-type cytochrome [Verrucomicrobiota bacterium]|nr:c-type cytochrome [Verrucomicrobiota bacterium]